uniref:SET domain-containing protein n=1 Tax=Caenorhabditis tropicalis TaxID=1561998 RepID=A0A1I7TLU7_9PELO
MARDLTIHHLFREADFKIDERDCIFSTPIRKTDLVLVENLTTGRFVAAEMSRWGVIEGQTFTKVIFKSTEMESDWIPLNAVFRPYPHLASLVFLTMRLEVLRSISCGDTCECTDDPEFVALAEHLKKQLAFKPKIESRPDPEFCNEDTHHQSYLNLFLPYLLNLPPISEKHEGIALDHSDSKGFFVKSVQQLEKDTDIGRYIGQYISEEEADRRIKLGKASNDRECKFYIYLTNLIVNGEEMTVGIDAAIHRNHLCMINHACKPNCKADTTTKHILAPGIVLELVNIKTITKIENNEELLLNYNMDGLKCWCSMTQNCRIRNQEDWAQPTCNLRKILNIKTNTRKRKHNDVSEGQETLENVCSDRNTSDANDNANDQGIQSSNHSSFNRELTVPESQFSGEDNRKNE